MGSIPAAGTQSWAIPIAGDTPKTVFFPCFGFRDVVLQ